MDADTTKRLAEVQEWLQKEYAGIRTGQANPALLDGIKVDNYGALTPLNQVGNVGTEDARTLRVSPWDVSQVQGIEQAILESDLGVSVVTDSAGLRVLFPELTSERREQLSKLAKAKLEDARITVRGVRDDAGKEIDKLEKDGEISKDEKFNRKEALQKAVDETNEALEKLFKQKETELAA